MNKPIKVKNNLLTSYVEDNRDKIDTALVSLRIVKQIDNYLDNINCNQKDLAIALGVTESYVSQLMSGSKKVNVQLINRFEKEFNVEFNFHIERKNPTYTTIRIVNSDVEYQTIRVQLSEAKTYNFRSNYNSEYLLDQEHSQVVIAE